jgi:hypothetical protein
LIREKPVVAQVKPGYLRHLIPGIFVVQSNTIKHSPKPNSFWLLQCCAPDLAPQKGHDLVSIVDDYQNVIVPGMDSNF